MINFFNNSRTFQLSRYFSIASLVTIIVAALLLSWMYRLLAIEDLTRQGEKNHIILTQTFANAIWPQVKFFIDTDRKTGLHGASQRENELNFKTLDASVKKLLKNTPVLNIKIFDLHGLTVYATDIEEVGKIMQEDYPGTQAANEGKATTELKFVDSINTVKGELKNRYILSSYLPVYDPATNDFRAIFEIYADVSEMYKKIISSGNNFALMVIIILGLVYTALFLLVRHADGVIRKQANEREDYLREIESINLDLDKIAKERALAHDKAVEASTYKSQFLANMSHELRTPLNAIIGYSEMLAEDMEHSNQAQAIGDLNKIQGAGKHLLTVINEILDISKIEAGRINLHLEDFDIAETVRGITATVEPLARKGNNTFTLNCPDDIGTIHTDVTRFRQILINLLGNACKFTHDGQVSLDITRSGTDDMEHIVCVVSDTGIGIGQENLEKIFEPFQQADSSTTREHGGTGLGLTISKRFCSMLGGSIRAESELGKGTRFIVKLPICSHDEQSPDFEQQRLPDVSDPSGDDDKLPRERRSKISRVLLIDDDPTARDLFRRFLEKHGFAVETASDGARGLAMARLNPPDLITLDVMLPGRDGWSVLQEVKQDPLLSTIPVIMISIINEESLGYSLGASDYLTKPIDWEQMGNVIRKWTRNAR